MRLEVFNHVVKRQMPAYRTISFNSKCGKVTLSLKLAADLEVKTGDGMYFARDTDNQKSWYFTVKKDDPLGVKITERLPTGNGNTRSFGGCSRPVCDAVLKDCKINKGATFLVAEKPVIVDGTEWWGILTAKPFRIS